MVGHGQWFTEHGSSQLLKRHGLVHGAAKLAIAAYSVPLPGQDGWAVAVFDDLHTSNKRWSNDAQTPLAWDACVEKQKRRKAVGIPGTTMLTHSSSPSQYIQATKLACQTDIQQLTL